MTHSAHRGIHNKMTKIFISYAHEDIASARRLYKQLKGVPGVEPWFDKENLLPGVKWRPAIRKAIRESDYFVALLSQRSISKKGYVQKEMKEALEIRDEFPEGQSFLLPIRIDNCQPPDSLSDTQYEDFFPNWKRGFERVVMAISSIPPAKNIKLGGTPMNSYEYRCGITDFDNGLVNLPQICQRLNTIQGFFHFNHPSITIGKKAPRRFDGSPNLLINKLPRTLYEQKAEHLNVDFVACLTKYLLAFEEEDGLFWNYLSVPSSVDDTFLFISTNQLYDATKEAGCTFEKGIAYNILSQLIVYFAADLGFHDEVSGCILDFCTDRSVMVKGLKAMRLCSKCSAKLTNPELKKAVGGILADALKV